MTNETTITLTGLEADAHRIHAEIIAECNRCVPSGFGTAERILADAFLAGWSTQRPRYEWEAIAFALHNIKITDAFMKRAFRRLRTHGWLYGKRVYRDGGSETCYGINFEGRA